MHTLEREGLSDMARRAISYRRVSDPKQRRGDGLNRQGDFAERICAKNGWTLDDTFVFEDRGRSGFHGDHRRGKGKLLAFLECVKRKRFAPGSVLIIENLDRLSRQELDEAHDLFRSILKSGIWIATEMPERIYTPESLKTLLGTIEPLLIMYVAHEQSKKLSVRIADKWERRRSAARSSGRPHGRNCPAWLSLTKDGYQIVPQRAATIRKIFELAAQGMGFLRIAKWLNEHRKEHPPFGRRCTHQWERSYVRLILSSRAPLGIYQPRKGRSGIDMQQEGAPIENYYPAVVSEDLWRMAHAAVSKRFRKAGRPGEVETNLFTGLVYDASTRGRMAVDTANGGSGPARRYLIDCQKSCKKRGIRGVAYQPFEDAMLRALELLRPEDVLPADAVHEERELRIAELTARQVALDHRMGEIQAQIEDPDSGEVVAALATGLKKLKKEQAEVEKELTHLKWDSSTGRAESLGETQSLLSLLRQSKNEDRAELRRRIKAAIGWIVESIWIVSQPLNKHNKISHVKVYLRNGKTLYLQILPLIPIGKNRGQPLKGLRPWNLRNADFRAGDVGDIAGEPVFVSQGQGD